MSDADLLNQVPQLRQRLTANIVDLRECIVKYENGRLKKRVNIKRIREALADARDMVERIDVYLATGTTPETRSAELREALLARAGVFFLKWR